MAIGGSVRCAFSGLVNSELRDRYMLVGDEESFVFFTLRLAAALSPSFVRYFEQVLGADIFLKHVRLEESKVFFFYVD